MRLSRSFFILLMVSQVALAQTKIAGPLTIKPGIQDGFILFNPVGSKVSYLIDNCGRVINKWQSQYAAAHTVYLLPNGDLARTKLLVNNQIDGGGGSGGGVEILDWDSNLRWSYTYNTSLHRHHHDISVLPNGNVILLAWELKTTSEAIAAGRNPAMITNNQVWPEHLVEVRPTSPTDGEIVWEWHAWDHLIQDFDATKPNYGVVTDHPELIDLNYPNGVKDWIHSNAIAYSTQLDQIIISAHSFNEIWVIDHSTTMVQASTHAGGRSNKGGDLLYRWGNPLAYRRGVPADVKLSGQHDVHWIDQGLPGEGKIMYFNNGPVRFYSSVEIVNPPRAADGSYVLTTGNPYGPTATDRYYEAGPRESFFSRIMGSAQILPNGNLFIGSSLQGKIFEVDANNSIIWEYKSPFTASGIVGRDFITTNPAFASTPNFRSTKYHRDYAAFTGRNLIPQEPIEGEPWADCALIITGLANDGMAELAVHPNPVYNMLYVKLQEQSFRVTILDSQGKKVYEGKGFDNLSIDTSGLTTGLYLIRVNSITRKFVVRN